MRKTYETHEYFPLNGHIILYRGRQIVMRKRCCENFVGAFDVSFHIIYESFFTYPGAKYLGSIMLRDNACMMSTM